MKTINVSKVQMNEIFVADGFRWAFLSRMDKLGAQSYEPTSPFVDALGQWTNGQEALNGPPTASR